MFITPIDTGALDAGKTTTSTKTNASSDPNAAQDRFLKLLVAQLNNQDPMNPLDNAQMTSQMAQINTVTGIQQLNQTMKSMADQFSAMQTLQGTLMIGRSVLTEGNQLAFADNKAVGAFELTSAATDVQVNILTPTGQLAGQVNLGALDKGPSDFSWDASNYQGDKSALRFEITATNQAGAVGATPLSQAKVIGTGVQDGALVLHLDSGASLPYSKIRSVL